MKVTHHTAPSIPKENVKPITPVATAPTPTTPPSDTASFSDEARAKVLTADGKNAASPAWRAREMIAEYESLGQAHFGTLVSALARGEEVPIAIEDTEQPAPVAPAAPPEPAAESSPTESAPADTLPAGTETTGY